MRIISQVIVLFFVQAILEVIVMALLAKFGVPYMDFDSYGEGVAELVISIGYYYSFSKIIVIVLPYMALMLLGDKVVKKVSLTQLNLFVSTLLMAVFWIGFNNPIKEIINPILGSFFSALFILFVIKIGSVVNVKQ